MNERKALYEVAYQIGSVSSIRSSISRMRGDCLSLERICRPF
jgi:hypothetical protein